MKTLKVLKNSLWISSVLLLTGCLTSQKEAMLPQTGATMKEVYDRNFQGHGTNPAEAGRRLAPLGNNRSIGDDAADLQGYTREAFNETRLVFHRLPNPDLVMYVFPHLSGSEGIPIPGYTTAFSFYETVQYALPGEVESD